MSSEDSPSKVDYEELDESLPAEPVLVPFDGTVSSDELFRNVVREGQLAIHGCILPSLIPSGSSGSYFIKNRKGVSF